MEFVYCNGNVYPFEPAGWPVTRLWLEDLDPVKETHDLAPLPAYGSLDDSGFNIKQIEDCSHLAEAVTKLSFFLVH